MKPTVCDDMSVVRQEALKALPEVLDNIKTWMEGTESSLSRLGGDFQCICGGITCNKTTVNVMAGLHHVIKHTFIIH